MSTTPSLRGDAQLEDVATRAPARCTPPEIVAEILLESMTGIAARLGRLEDAETAPQRRADLAKLRQAVLARRFEFDPHDAAQIDAFRMEFGALAGALKQTEDAAGG